MTDTRSPTEVFAIRCPAPGCPDSWPSNIPSDVLLKLLDIHERTAHPTTTPATAPSATGAKAEKVKRPVISVSGTSEQWTYFKQRWSEYKIATRLTVRTSYFSSLNAVTRPYAEIYQEVSLTSHPATKILSSKT